MQAKATDILTFKIGNLKFPRVRSDYKFECKPIYTNVNTSQTGVTSQTFVRDQIVISNVNFDPITVQEYKALAQAMNIGTGTGGSFSLTYFNFITGKEVYKLKEIEHYCKTKIKAKPIPSLDDVKNTKVDAIFANIRETIEAGGISDMIELVEDHVNNEDYTAMDMQSNISDKSKFFSIFILRSIYFRIF